jgi:ubiquinol-cytochrome c reductase cytochrome b subunit
VGHYTLVPNPFWGGALFPLIVLIALVAVPWAERWLTRDRSFHNVLDRPRDAPGRTAFGVAFLTWVVLVFAFGAADRTFVLFDLSYNLQLAIFRIGVWLVPLALFFGVRRWCRELQAAEQVEEIQERAEEEQAALERAAAGHAVAADTAVSLMRPGPGSSQ